MMVRYVHDCKLHLLMTWWYIVSTAAGFAIGHQIKCVSQSCVVLIQFLRMKTIMRPFYASIFYTWIHGDHSTLASNQDCVQECARDWYLRDVFTAVERNIAYNAGIVAAVKEIKEKSIACSHSRIESVRVLDLAHGWSLTSSEFRPTKTYKSSHGCGEAREFLAWGCPAHRWDKYLAFKGRYGHGCRKWVNMDLHGLEIELKCDGRTA